MNPVERLQAAIEKLETLKAESTEPTGGRDSWLQGSIRRPFEDDGEVYSGPVEVRVSSDIITHIQAEDARLIVTLHRTIDAQLAILRSAFGDSSGSHDEPNAFRLALALADAILGGDS